MANIIKVFGLYENIGTTMIAQSIASVLSKNNRILLVLTNSMQDLTFLVEDIVVRSFDDLKSPLASKKLTKTDINNIMMKNEDFDVMPPVDDVFDAKSYQVNDINEVIKLIETDYDYIIIDAGSNIQLPLTIGALTLEGELFVIGNQQIKTIEKYKKYCDTLFKIMKLDHKLIINKYEDVIPFYSIETIKKHLTFSVPEIISVSKVKQSIKAEINKETLLRDREFKNDILKLLGQKQNVSGTEIKKKFWRK